MRILLSKKSRLKLLEILKDKNKVNTLKALAQSMNIPFKTLNHWFYSGGYIPEEIIPEDPKESLEILDKQEDHWGQVKAGKIGGKSSIKILKKKIRAGLYKEQMKEGGKKSMKKLREKYGKRLQDLILKGKIEKRENESQKLQMMNQEFFINERVFLNCSKIGYSTYDIKKGIKFPNEMNKDLAEECGIHLGDGCLSKSRNYFSVKTNKTEKNYMNYLFELYKRVYNLDLKLMVLPSVVGFEIYSKALCEFKNKVLGLPYGEKIHNIEVPKAVFDTKNKEIYKAFIRGLFDTDGCICIVKKNHKNYPLVSLCIHSEKLIEQVSEMLKKMGYLPFHNKESITLNGTVMFKKWAQEIGSNNSKNFGKLLRASSIIG